MAVRVLRGDWLARLGLEPGDRIIGIGANDICRGEDFLGAYVRYRSSRRLTVDVLRPTRAVIRYRID